VCELPVARSLVHRTCYERETGQRPRIADTLIQYLFRRQQPHAA
jgi:hypothetical protein